MHHPEAVRGQKVRQRSPTFADHFSQAALFFQSLTPPEQQHLQQALTFELSKVTRPVIRERMVGVLSQIDAPLAKAVASAVGVTPPRPAKRTVKVSPALSMSHNNPDTIASRKIAFLCAKDANGKQVDAMRDALQVQGAIVEILHPTLTPLQPGDISPDKTWVAGPWGLRCGLCACCCIPCRTASRRAVRRRGLFAWQGHCRHRRRQQMAYLGAQALR